MGLLSLFSFETGVERTDDFFIDRLGSFDAFLDDDDDDVFFITGLAAEDCPNQPPPPRVVVTVRRNNNGSRIFPVGIGAVVAEAAEAALTT